MNYKVVIVLMIMASIARGEKQDTLFFRGFKGTEYFALLPRSMTFSPVDSSLSPLDFAEDYPELLLTAETKKVASHVYVAKVLDTVNIDSLLERMNNDERIEYAIRNGLSKGSAVAYLSNRIWVILHSATTRTKTEADITSLGLMIDSTAPKRPEIISVSINKRELNNYHLILDSIEGISDIQCFIPAFWSNGRMLNAPNDPWWTEQEQMWVNNLNLEQAYNFALRPDSVSIHFFYDGVAIHEDFPQPYSITGYNWARLQSQFTMGSYSKHGMGTTGVAYAKFNNAIGIAGFNNSNFRIRVQQIFVTGSESTQTYIAEDFSIYLALDSSAKNGADIINHSWGFDDCNNDDPGGLISAGLDSCRKYGVLTVASSGNCDDPDLGCGCVHFPAKYQHVLAVGGLNNASQHDYETSYGPELDVAAYSLNVPTLSLMGAQYHAQYPSSLVTDCQSLPLNYRCMSGTSISAPQVTAIAGLVLAKRPDFKNKPDTLSKILRYSTDDGAAPCALDTFRHDDQIGYGRVDAYRALHSVSRANINNYGIIDLSDMGCLSSYLSTGQPVPQPDIYIADVNCDCTISLTDLSALIAYLTGGPPIPLCFRFPN